MRRAIAIDLGGTDLRVGLVDESGRVLALETVLTDTAAEPATVVETMVRRAEQLRAGVPVAGIGVCAPGPLDPGRGVVLAPPTLPTWRDVPLAQMLSRRLGLAAALDNDGHAAALGEWRHGAGRGCSDFVYITVSTGIGGGIVSGKRLLRGRLGLAGHVGHMTVASDSPPCACGNRGCWEALASGTAWGRAARAALSREEGSRIAQCAGADPVSARHVAEAARLGDPLALELVAQEARWLGIGIVNLLHLFSPERVVIGGGVSACLDLLLPGIRTMVAERALPAFRSVEIAGAELGRAAGLVGAAVLAFEAQG